MNAPLPRACQSSIFAPLLFLLLAVIGAIAMLWLAFYNEYPLIYFDTLGYLVDDSGAVRPLGFNIIINAVTSIMPSLWAVAIFQAFVTSYLLMRNLCLFLCSGRNAIWTSFTVVICLIIVTDISTWASFIMPRMIL